MIPRAAGAAGLQLLLALELPVEMSWPDSYTCTCTPIPNDKRFAPEGWQSGILVEGGNETTADLKMPWYIKLTPTHCSACFRDPHHPDDHIFEAKLLPSVTMPPRTLKPRGVLGPYQPQIGFSRRDGPQRSYSTPQPARRMIRCGYIVVAWWLLL